MRQALEEGLLGTEGMLGALQTTAGLPHKQREGRGHKEVLQCPRSKVKAVQGKLDTLGRRWCLLLVSGRYHRLRNKTASFLHWFWVHT